MLIDAEAFQVFGQRGLDPLIQGREVRTGILFDLALEAMELLDLIDVVGDLDAVVVDLSVDGGALDNQASVLAAICDKDGEIAVVLGFGATFFIFILVLAVRKLLVVRDRLSGLECDLNDFASDLLFQRHENAL